MKNLLKRKGVQSLIASLLCIVLGLLLGYVVLLFINPAGAGQAILAVIRNFLNVSKANLQLKNLGNTLVKTAPLLMCSLSVLFAYKVGLSTSAWPDSMWSGPPPDCTRRCSGAGAGCPACCWPLPWARCPGPLWGC